MKRVRATIYTSIGLSMQYGRLRIPFCVPAPSRENGFFRTLSFYVKKCKPWSLHHAQQSERSFTSSPERGAKSKASVRFKDLPQGVLSPEVKLDALDEKDAAPVYPTVIQQAYNNMQKFDNCVLLTKVGGFYEVRINVICRFT